MKIKYGRYLIPVMALVIAAAFPAAAEETGTETQISVIYADEDTEPDMMSAVEAMNSRVVVSEAEKVPEEESEANVIIAPAEETEGAASEEGAEEIKTESAGEAAAEETESTEETGETAQKTEKVSIGQQIAGFAMQFLGGPYAWGGSSLTRGTDCSGFTMSVFSNFGISLPHSSASQRSIGTAVDSLENAEPGDLVCYSGHVGLYVGNGQIVHALNEKKGIVVSNAGFDRILAIRRVI